MQDLNDLYFFAQVINHNGFAAAARALGMPRSRLSRRIGLLEERLGVRLIQRSTRRFSVTEIGREYHRHCTAMLVEAEAAQEAIERARATPRGIVQVSCPSALLYFEVGEMVARFMAECPQVEVHLESTNRRVDVIREGFDVALRVRFPPLEESDLVMRVLAESTQRLVAHPRVLEGRSLPIVPADLGALPSLSWGSSHQNHAWSLVGPNGATARVPHRPRFVSEDMVTLRLAALRGVGVVQMPTMVVRRDLSEGALVDVLPAGWAPPTGIIHAVFPSRRGLLPSVRSLLDFLANAYTALGRRSSREGRRGGRVRAGRAAAGAPAAVTFLLWRGRPTGRVLAKRPNTQGGNTAWTVADSWQAGPRAPPPPPRSPPPISPPRSRSSAGAARAATRSPWTRSGPATSCFASAFPS
jgi:DNA-binding transcriptional LysR family regulator